jgi:hypothetical protein
MEKRGVAGVREDNSVGRSLRFIRYRPKTNFDRFGWLGHRCTAGSAVIFIAFSLHVFAQWCVGLTANVTLVVYVFCEESAISSIAAVG